MFLFHTFILPTVARREPSMKSIFRWTYREEFFWHIREQRASSHPWRVFHFRGHRQSLHPLILNQLTPYHSQTAAQSLCHLQRLWWTHSDWKFWKVQDWQNCELKKVPSNCANWCLATGNWAIRETIHRPREKLPACLSQIRSVFPWRVQSHQEHF